MLMRDIKRGGIRSTKAMENDSPHTIDTSVRSEPSCGFGFWQCGGMPGKKNPLKKKKKQQQRAEVHLALLYQLSNLQLP